MRILAIGDIIGNPGRQTIQRLLPGIRQDYDVDMVIANGENVAGGFGLTSNTAKDLFNAGVDMMTSGNHIWAQKEILPYLDSEMPIIRPLNYPAGVIGRGWRIYNNRVMVVNVIGRTFIGNFDCPFRAMDKVLAEVKERPKIIIVDFHAEATSEKVAMGYYLDGRVSAMVGTHTHVGTCDARILPKGSAYVTDIGMTGPINSVIGDDIEDVLQRFLTDIPSRLSVAKGPCSVNAVLMNIDDNTGLGTSIERVYREGE
jgi:2',3'-cyclic-nucleotide 2'-phosphodiesterase